MQALDSTESPSPKETRIVTFLGVTTKASSIVRIFPAWARACGLNLALRCIDLPMMSTADQYRSVANDLLTEPWVLGMVITGHKRRMYEAVSDLLVDSDPYARAGREVSPLLASDRGLVADACDPRTVRLVLDHLLGPRYWHDTTADALILGSGGAGISIALTLLTRRVGQRLASSDDAPRRLVITDVVAQRADLARELLQPYSGTSEIKVYKVDRDQTTRLLETLSPGSLVVNATGMGKDTPGSPVAPTAVFPERARVLEANYRGNRPFLRQAEAQAQAKALVLQDGWNYFVHGWTEALAPMVPGGMSSERAAMFETIATTGPAGTHR